MSILLIEDNPAYKRLVEESLAEGSQGVFDYELTWVSRIGQGLESLTKDRFDVVLLDLLLPDSAGLVSLDRVVEHAPHVPVVVLTGVEDEEQALEAVNRGAQDYLFKALIDPDILARSVRYAVERGRSRRSRPPAGQDGPRGAPRGRVGRDDAARHAAGDITPDHARIAHVAHRLGARLEAALAQLDRLDEAVDDGPSGGTTRRLTLLASALRDALEDGQGLADQLDQLVSSAPGPAPRIAGGADAPPTEPTEPAATGTASPARDEGLEATG